MFKTLIYLKGNLKKIKSRRHIDRLVFPEEGRDPEKFEIIKNELKTSLEGRIEKISKPIRRISRFVAITLGTTALYIITMGTLSASMINFEEAFVLPTKFEHIALGMGLGGLIGGMYELELGIKKRKYLDMIDYLDQLEPETVRFESYDYKPRITMATEA